MAQQTAVEWFAFQIMNSWNDIQNGKTSIDEFIEKAKQMERQKLIGLLNWMNEVVKNNPMAFETDHDDIVDMYLNGYYGSQGSLDTTTPPTHKTNNMTLKEKAAELINKMYYTQSSPTSWVQAKQCALIAVEEIIKQNVSTPNDYGASWTYWMLVKQEIEKL